MKSKYTLRQKLIVPFIIFAGMIIVGVRSMYKGMELHQNWRVALAALGVVCFTTLLVFLLITVAREEKPKAKF
jgi:fumarate reductase subunit C